MLPCFAAPGAEVTTGLRNSRADVLAIVAVRDMAARDLAEKPALSITASYNAAPETDALAAGNCVIWESGVIWGTNVIRGVFDMSATGVIWGSSVASGRAGTRNADGISILGEG